MTHPNNAKSQRSSKKRLRKKQAVLVKRCVQALNSNADIFRSKMSNAEPSQSAKAQSDGTLKHFKPIRIETVDQSTISDAVDMLENKFTIDEPGQEEKREKV
ncbi:unnamed protein product [Rodentolepis nana]|uniref:Uncharacterized protein n=1 Tax=Rodentolepis nana TaxID=102285 RepID=A0A0R3TP54_RODNA|nr:unnamed protein product [Rodentolepis nana]